MVTLESADNALKTIYLGVVSNQLNVNANPLLGKILQTTSDVWGNEIRKLAPYGLNGGIGAGEEAGDLPSSAQNNYVKFVSELKNLYGTINISDKAPRGCGHFRPRRRMDAACRASRRNRPRRPRRLAGTACRHGIRPSIRS